MFAGYYIYKPGTEKEAVDRWENEGGRITQNPAYIFDHIREDYRRYKDQVIEIRRFGSGMISEIQPWPEGTTAHWKA